MNQFSFSTIGFSVAGKGQYIHFYFAWVFQLQALKEYKFYSHPLS